MRRVKIAISSPQAGYNPITGQEEDITPTSVGSKRAAGRSLKAIYHQDQARKLRQFPMQDNIDVLAPIHDDGSIGAVKNSVVESTSWLKQGTKSGPYIMNSLKQSQSMSNCKSIRAERSSMPLSQQIEINSNLRKMIKDPVGFASQRDLSSPKTGINQLEAIASTHERYLSQLPQIQKSYQHLE